MENSVPELIDRGRGFTLQNRDVVDWIRQQPVDSYYLTSEGRVYYQLEPIAPGKTVHFHIRLQGGKGGFGSILRSFRIHRSTNQNMCRTLSGRRLADVKEEERLKKWIEKKAERDKAKEEKKREKLERLKNGGPKHQFADQDYLRKRDLVLDQVEDAIEAGVRAQREKELAEQRALGLATDGDDDNKAKDSDSDGSDSDTTTSDSNTDEDKEEEGINSVEPSTSTQAMRKRKTSPPADDGGCGDRPTKKQKVDYTADAIFDYYTEKFVGDVAESVVVEKTKLEPLAEDTARTAKASISALISSRAESTSAANGGKTAERQRVMELKRTEPVDYPPIKLASFTTTEELEKLGLDHLKHALEIRGMKCGGTLRDRALRLLSVKGLSRDKYPKEVLKPLAKGK